MRVEPLPAPIAAENVCASYSLAHYGRTLILAVQGEVSNRRECIGIYRILMDALELVLQTFKPSALVFDFAEVQYEWGDGMAELLGSWDLPIAIVTSPQNEHALSTLVADELFWEPPLPLYESREAAIAAVHDGEAKTGAT